MQCSIKTLIVLQCVQLMDIDLYILWLKVQLWSINWAKTGHSIVRFEVSSATGQYTLKPDCPVETRTGGKPGYGSNVICQICEKANTALESRSKSLECVKMQADKMLNRSNTSLPSIEIGKSVTISIPNVDKGSGTIRLKTLCLTGNWFNSQLV